MKVHVTVDTDEVARRANEQSNTYVDVESDVIDGSLEVVVQAVMNSLSFSFSQTDVEVSSVTYLDDRRRR